MADSLAMYQQRCADLEVERTSYQSSHAKLLREVAPLPAGLAPIVGSSKGLELALQFTKIVLLVILILVVGLK